jgi:hypothetical protein
MNFKEWFRARRVRRLKLALAMTEAEQRRSDEITECTDVISPLSEKERARKLAKLKFLLAEMGTS